jgi:hypothetical protein
MPWKIELDTTMLKADRSDRIEQTDWSLLSYRFGQDRADLRLHRPAMFGSSHAEPGFDLRIEIANADRCHCLHL